MCRLNIKDYKKAEKKECNKCQRFLELNNINFFKNARAVDGFWDICKICFMQRHKEWYSKNKNIINKFRRKRDKRQKKLLIENIID